MAEPRPDAATVVALTVFPGPGSRGPAQPVARAEAVAGRGLDGDRHAARPREHRQLLVVEQEVLDELGLAPGAIREQMTVRGLGLDALAEGATIEIGGARFTVGIPCEPCSRMDEIRPGLRAELDGRRGRFFRVVASGPLAVGDRIVVRG
jgi:MOSC domain-containing protein YiiM